jgi:hypothetical protein
MMGTFSINKVAAYRLNLPGPNARVNISSMDNLTNIVQFFAELGDSAVRLSGAALRRCSKQTVKNGHPDKKLTAKKFVAGVGLATQSTSGFTLPHGLVRPQTSPLAQSGKKKLPPRRQLGDDNSDIVLSVFRMVLSRRQVERS